jgi:dihydrofolate reductase
MRISVIAAVDRRGLIGDERGLPWHLPRDLRRFRNLTLGKPVIMGRTTHEHVGRPLPGRQNIVLSRNPDRSFPGCALAHSFAEALQVSGDAEEAFVIGGAALYREALPRADRLYLTLVDGQFSGTTYFPCELVKTGEWVVSQREVCESDEKNPHRHLYLVLQRAAPGGALTTSFDLSAILAAPF